MTESGTGALRSRRRHAAVVQRRCAGAAWNDDYEGAWQRAYTFAAGAMMVAAVDVGQ